MAEKVALDKAWAEAARRCRLSPADVRMAKELGFNPRSLLKNQPSPQQPWKAPVAEWVRELYAKRQRRSEHRCRRRERGQPVSRTCLPVAGMPMNSPLRIKLAVQRSNTRSP